MTITDSEKERITDGALRIMQEKAAHPVILNLDLQHAVGIVSNLQLAFRHPENTGPTRDAMEKFVHDLIEKLDPDHGDFYRLLMMGFDETYDE